MANSMYDVQGTATKQIMAKFVEEFNAQKVLSKTLNIPMERKKVGKWAALWLKITFREPPMVYVLPASKGDTITIRRPLYVFGDSTTEGDGFTREDKY